VGGSYSDIDGDSDPEDSAIRCSFIHAKRVSVSHNSPCIQRRN
jgi:hypothetical protein